MADWLLLLLKLGGFGAVLVLVLLGMGKWFLKKINAALDSYVAAYAQQTASIDARIANLAKLAEEQAKLTRTVESIKDEIAAQAKSRDNRWAFRKEIYVTLIKTSHDLLKLLHNFASAVEFKADPNPTLRKLALKTVEEDTPQFTASIKELTTYAALAPLATADDVLPILAAASDQAFRKIDFDSPDTAAQLQAQMRTLRALLEQLQIAGRKDLWGTPEAEAKPGTARQT